jgi:hypothetical protein
MLRKEGEMPKYTIRLDTVIMGMDTLTIDVLDEYEVGQTISISPTSHINVQSDEGSVTLGPEVTISGTVVAKE